MARRAKAGAASSRSQLVSHAPDGGNAVAQDAELLAQAHDMRVDRAVEADVLLAPDSLQQVVAAVGPPRLLGEHGQQIELFGREVERRPPMLAVRPSISMCSSPTSRLRGAFPACQTVISST